MRYYGPSAEDVVNELQLDTSCFNGKNIFGRGSVLNITEEMCEVVKTLFDHNVKIMSIAKYLGMSSTTVSAILNDRVVITTDEDIRIDRGKIKALYRAGWNIKSIAEDCMVTEQIVIDTLRNKI